MKLQQTISLLIRRSGMHHIKVDSVSMDECNLHIVFPCLPNWEDFQDEDGNSNISLNRSRLVMDCTKLCSQIPPLKFGRVYCWDSAQPLLRPRVYLLFIALNLTIMSAFLDSSRCQSDIGPLPTIATVFDVLLCSTSASLSAEPCNHFASVPIMAGFHRGRGSGPPWYCHCKATDCWPLAKVTNCSWQAYVYSSVCSGHRVLAASFFRCSVATLCGFDPLAYASIFIVLASFSLWRKRGFCPQCYKA